MLVFPSLLRLLDELEDGVCPVWIYLYKTILAIMMFVFRCIRNSELLLNSVFIGGIDRESKSISLTRCWMALRVGCFREKDSASSCGLNDVGLGTCDCKDKILNVECRCVGRCLRLLAATDV